MSIRSLTTRLREEAEELRRRHQFDASRAQNTPNAPATSSASPQSAHRPLPVSDEHPSSTGKQVRLKKREEEESWRIPGGISARFGRQALHHASPVVQPVAEISKPETPLAVAPDAHQQHTPKPDREAREKATRITIELQSH